MCLCVYFLMDFSVLNVRMWSLKARAVNNDQSNCMDFKLDETFGILHPWYRQTNINLEMNETHQNSCSIVQFRCIYLCWRNGNNNKNRNKMLNCFWKCKLCIAIDQFTVWLLKQRKLTQIRWKNRGFERFKYDSGFGNYWIFVNSHVKMSYTCNSNGLLLKRWSSWYLQ